MNEKELTYPNIEYLSREDASLQYFADIVTGSSEALIGVACLGLALLTRNRNKSVPIALSGVGLTSLALARSSIKDANVIEREYEL